MKRTTVCGEQGCWQLTPCQAHPPRQAWSGSGRRRELPPDWRARRQQVLNRDGHRCTHIDHGVRCPAAATEVHHLGDKHDHRLEMLASLCAPHHRAETQAEAAAARRANRGP